MRVVFILISAVSLLSCRERSNVSSVAENKTKNVAIENEGLEKALKVFFEDPVTANVMTHEYLAYLELRRSVAMHEMALAKEKDDEAKLEISEEIESLNENYRVEHANGEVRIKSALAVLEKVNKLQFRDYFLTDDDLHRIKGYDTARYNSLKKSRDDIVVAVGKIKNENQELVLKWENEQLALMKILESSDSDSVKLAADSQIENYNAAFKLRWTGFLFLKNTTN